jgi:hypothetical protein
MLRTVLRTVLCTPTQIGQYIGEYYGAAAERGARWSDDTPDIEAVQTLEASFISTCPSIHVFIRRKPLSLPRNFLRPHFVTVSGC